MPLQIDVAKEAFAGARAEEARATPKTTTDEVTKSISEEASAQLAEAGRTLAKQEFDRFATLPQVIAPRPRG